MRVLSIPRLLLTALLLTGCRAESPPPVLAAAPADPAGERAAGILQRCAARPPAEAMGCHERALLAVLRSEGVHPAMTVLERMGQMDGAVQREGHVYAHAIGLAAYTTPEEVGEVFGRCTPIFQSGCYHGVIQSYFAELAGGAGPAGVTAEAVNALCAAQRGEGGRWLLFQCAHGLGHGLTMLHDHHLPRALGGCDLVSDAWERESCYGGAMMESMVQAMAPHHTVGRPQPAGGHGGAHDHHAAPSAEPAFRALDPDDPLYPCTVLEERYLAACYQMQTSAVLFFHAGDMRAAVRACRAAPERYRALCYASMGRDISSYTLQDHREALRLCAMAGPDHRVHCHTGYVKNVVDLTARAEDGFAFCRTVPAPDERRRCYEDVGQEVWVLEGSTERRRLLCAGAEPGYVEACRSGARLRPQGTGGGTREGRPRSRTSAPAPAVAGG